MDGDFVKVLAWYDNEWGYSSRCVDLLKISCRCDHRTRWPSTLDSRLSRSRIGQSARSSASTSTSRSRTGTITDDTRITASLPTIQRRARCAARTVVLASHLGRPKGKPAPEFSLQPVAARLAELLKREVAFADDCIGEPAAAAPSRRRMPSRLEGRAAREPALPRRGRKERRGVRRGAGRARRRLRQRRVWRRASRARVGRGDRAALRHKAAAGPADGKGAALSRHGARRSRSAVCRHPRRREGVGQDRGHRELPRPRSIAC